MGERRDACQRARQVLGLLRLERRGRQQALTVADQIVGAGVADGHAEVLRRHILDLMRFVHDERRARRNHLAVRARAHRRIGAQQVMVDDHDVRLRRALAHQRDMAIAVARALGAETGVRVGRDLLPQRKVFGQVAQLGAVAGCRGPGPVLNHREEDRSFGRFEESAGFRRFKRLKAMEAQVVRAAFHQRRRERDAQRLAQCRQILEEDLFLKILGAGGHQRALPAEDRGDEVREGLARAGTGFGEQRAAALDDAAHGRGHLPLPVARLEAGERLRQRTRVREHHGDVGLAVRAHIEGSVYGDNAASG